MTSIRNFVAEVPKELLQEFLVLHSLELQPEQLADSPKKVAQAIQALLEEQPPEIRNKIFSAIEAIGELAKEAGILAVEETMFEFTEDLPSARARALWLHINNPTVFASAESILYQNTHRGGRLFTAFRIASGIDLNRDEEALRGFVHELKKLFKCENVSVEVFDRMQWASGQGEADGTEPNAANVVQLMIYREGLPVMDRVFREGQIAEQSRRPVIEASMTYERESGVIECVAAKRETRAEIVGIFAQCVLLSAEKIEPRPLPRYDLTVLRQRQSFPVDPEDQVTKVYVAMLRLVPVNSWYASIVVACEANQGGDIWNLIESRLGVNALASDYQITQARIVIRHAFGPTKRIRSLPVTITPPNRSSIKEQTEFERVIATKYLQRWRLVAA